MSITIGEFAQKLGEAGIQASKACEGYADHRLDDAFDKGDDGVLVPKTRRIRILDQEIDIPTVALLSERRIDVDTLDFEFEATVEMDGEHPRMVNHVGLFRRGVKIKAKVSFKAGDSLEALELIRERVNRDIAEKLSVRREPSG